MSETKLGKNDFPVQTLGGRIFMRRPNETRIAPVQYFIGYEHTLP